MDCLCKEAIYLHKLLASTILNLSTHHSKKNFRLIERKYLKGKLVPTTKRFSARGLKIRKEVGRGPIYRLLINK